MLFELKQVKGPQLKLRLAREWVCHRSKQMAGEQVKKTGDSRPWMRVQKLSAQNWITMLKRHSCQGCGISIGQLMYDF